MSINKWKIYKDLQLKVSRLNRSYKECAVIKDRVYSKTHYKSACDLNKASRRVNF